jgi:RNA polymerase sigma factor (sigma-70 family)
VADADPHDTLALTTAMAAGDAAAVAAFYRSHFPLMYAAARRATGGGDEATCLDAVQDAMLRIVSAVRPIDSPGQLRAWTVLVVRTVAYDHLRSAARRRRHEAAAVPVGSSAADDAADADEHRTWLAEQLSQLDPALVRLIDLRYQHRWTLARIAVAVGLPVGTVDGRLRRAIGRLQRQAAEDFRDG